MTTRRTFLKHTIGSTALVSMTPAIPTFLLDTSRAAAAQGKRGDSGGGGNILVVVQLSGGNDGLNTVIPYADDGYLRNRSALRYGAGAVRKIDDYHGLHPSMTGFEELLESQQLGIVQGVGYPNPNRSHFESMDIWHTADADTRAGGYGIVGGGAGGAGRQTGWLGRYLDAATRTDGRDVPALHLGPDRQPLALAADATRVPSVSDLDGFRLEVGGDASLRRAIETAARMNRDNDNDLLRFVQRSTVGALASSQRVQEALSRYTTPIAYPGTPLAQQLRTIAQLIEAGMSTRVYYVSLNGFDTHSNQQNAHAELLRTFSDAVTAFVKDMTHHGHADRVLVMSFSEFGRRVKENASAGTDHGAAAPMFLAGGRVAPGLIGNHPRLDDLDQGDLKHHTDFRAVYATILRQWLGFEDPAQVLGGAFGPVKVLA